MYNNIGQKLKTLAKVIAWIGIIGSFIYGFVLITKGIENLNSYRSYLDDVSSALIWAGVGVIIFGSLFSWISSWALYAIGDTNEKTNEMYKKSLVLNCDNGADKTYISTVYTKTENSDKVSHHFRCDKCGMMISGYPCIRCGNNP